MEKNKLLSVNVDKLADEANQQLNVGRTVSRGKYMYPKELETEREIKKFRRGTIQPLLRKYLTELEPNEDNLIHFFAVCKKYISGFVSFDNITEANDIYNFRLDNQKRKANENLKKYKSLIS